MPPFCEFFRISNHPAHDGAWGDHYTQLPCDLSHVAIAELKSKIPANTRRNHIIGKPATAEQRVPGTAAAGHPVIVSSTLFRNATEPAGLAGAEAVGKAAWLEVERIKNPVNLNLAQKQFALDIGELSVLRR